ncbi:O-antigen acetylase [Legionella wadsworthii]|uniref:O-antigen acetylase n=1 Tax=Legionella wadsworthii TaxID=28088 RepID=A0A378LSY5_9GAMM|nr:acyltransferase family protein [Legionella wadsworthii]STY28952.1 O-antigen acetylase [Legionella wadsworthii]
MYPSNKIHSVYRADIDGLRAVAVLWVVAFHAFPEIFKGGFIGVDVFFVISGYLITSIIFENLDRGSFSFKEFYIRRIKRIFPALIVVLVSCLIFGWFALLPDEYKQLGKHIVGSTGFVQNIILWGEAGYFDNSAETKPLLHIWSLGVEEQFYFVWPLLIWFAWKQKFNLFLVTLCLALISFILNVRGINDDFVVSFYSPQTRFWELLSGGLLALINRYKRDKYQKFEIKIDTVLSQILYRAHLNEKGTFFINFLSIFGSFILIYGFCVISKDSSFPGKWAVIPVLGTVLIIYAGSNSWINRVVLSNNLLIWFGLISFPLYLWHWPILSFLRIIESQTPSWIIRIAAVILSILLSWITYKLIECPIRFGERGRGKVIILLLIMILIGFFGYQDYIREGFGSRFSNLVKEQSHNRDTLNLAYEEALKNCKKIFPQWQTITDNPCLLQKEAHNSIAIIGDSHAGQLFPGMSKYLDYKSSSVAVFSASCAAPLLGVSSGINLANTSILKIRKDAYKLIDTAYNYILNDQEIKTVILAHNPTCSYNDAVDVANPEDKDYRHVLREGMKRTFSKLIKSGKKILVLFDNPSINFDPKKCQWRPLRITKNDICSFSRKSFDDNPAYDSYRSLVKEILKDFPQVKTFDLSELLCDKKKCYIIKNNQVIYDDSNHLNSYGSEFIAPYLIMAMNKI